MSEVPLYPPDLRAPVSLEAERVIHRQIPLASYRFSFTPPLLYPLPQPYTLNPTP